jgi:hypothetical protein
MIRYFCDRCDAEVEHHTELVVFNAEVGEASASGSWRIRRELCPKCLEETKELLNKFFSKSAATKKRTA